MKKISRTKSPSIFDDFDRARDLKIRRHAEVVDVGAGSD